MTVEERTGQSQPYRELAEEVAQEVRRRGYLHLGGRVVKIDEVEVVRDGTHNSAWGVAVVPVVGITSKDIRMVDSLRPDDELSHVNISLRKPGVALVILEGYEGLSRNKAVVVYREAA